MTTVIRYKNLIVTDDVYVDVIGSEVVKSRGPHKLYRHPHFNVICALSGAVSAGMFQLLNRHVSNYLANLKDYPNQDISVFDLQEEYNQSNLEKEKGVGFEFAAYTKDMTLFIHFAKVSKEFVMSIKPADKLFIIGTGADIVSKTQVFKDHDPNFDARTAAIIAAQADTFTGNNFYVFDINELGDL